MKTMNSALLAALFLALAGTAASAQDLAALRAKSDECKKLKGGSPEHAKCQEELKALMSTATKGGSLTPPPKNAPITAQEIQAGGVSGAQGVTGLNLQGMDLETAMMKVQSERAKLLEGQLKTQLDAVQQRNKDIAKLNELIGKLKSLRPAGTDPQKFGNLGANQAEGRAVYQSLKDAGVTMPTGDDLVDEPGTNIYDARQKTYDIWVEQLKGKVDSLNSSQQMDMLRMQSLTNKRNEAFDTMTNFIKKMQDSRASILGNMR